MISEQAQSRLWEKVRMPSTANGCLIWTGKTDGNGAPEFYIDARSGRCKRGKARRVLYEMCVRELPTTVELSPHCDESLCIAPNCQDEHGRGWKNPYRRHAFMENRTRT